MPATRALTLGFVAVAVAVAPGMARAHGTGSHSGFQARVSYVEPMQPGLLVQVLGGHQWLSVRNWTAKTVVLFDARGRIELRLRPGQTRSVADPRIGPRGPPPNREQLVRTWRIRGTADGEPFVIVGFLGYRPPDAAATEGHTGAWKIVLGVGAGVLVLGAALALPLLRKGESDPEERPTAP